MIEVIVSAAVLAMLALAVLSGMDGASRASGREKARSVAATLAEQDQERLRSQQFYTLVALAAGAPAVQNLTVDGIQYQVQSQATWQVDSTTGTNSCTSQSTNANYLKISTTVTSKVVGTRIVPVQQDSLVAPSPQYAADHGSLGVKIVDHANAGVAGIAVSTSGAGSYNGVTDANGCVVFSNISVGTYTVTVNSLGYVDQKGNTSSSVDGEVVSGSTTVSTIIYDKAATTPVTRVDTYPPNATSTSAVMASKAPTVTGTHSTVVGLLRTYPNPFNNQMNSTWTADKLFPFSTPYQFFTGSCSSDNPSTYDSTYWSKTPALPGAFQAVPGQTGSGITVRQPPLLVNLKNNFSGALTATSAGNITVWAIPQNSGCTDPNITDLKLLQWTSTNGAPTTGTPSQYGWVGRANGTNTATGKTVPESGVPFGKYKLCFKDSGTNKVMLWPDATGSSTPYDATQPYRGTTNPLVVPTTATWKSPNGYISGVC